MPNKPKGLPKTGGRKKGSVNKPEWDMIPGLLRYNNRQDFQAVLNKIKAEKVDKVGLVKQARAYISEHLTVQKLNEKRLEVIKSLQA